MEYAIYQLVQDFSHEEYVSFRKDKIIISWKMCRRQRLQMVGYLFEFPGSNS